MSELTGTERLTAPVAWVGANLADAAFLAGCLPDATMLDVTPDRARFQVKPKLSIFSGTVEIELLRQDSTETIIRYQLVATAPGAGSTLEVELHLDAESDSTQIRWYATHREIRGMLKMVPKGVLHAMMRPIIAEVWTAIRAKLPAT